jgi:hypothetical protein
MFNFGPPCIEHTILNEMNKICQSKKNYFNKVFDKMEITSCPHPQTSLRRTFSSIHTEKISPSSSAKETIPTKIPI